MIRAYVVVPIEFDPDAGETLDQKFQVLMRGPKEHFAETGEQFTGPVWITADEQDMQLLDDLKLDAKLGAGRHTLVVENERWHLRHSLACRRAGLENCPITSLVAVGMDEPMWDVGEHELRLDESGVLLWEEDL